LVFEWLSLLPNRFAFYGQWKEQEQEHSPYFDSKLSRQRRTKFRRLGFQARFISFKKSIPLMEQSE
jgi:hypothetical protein